MLLTAVEARVLGSLMEKETTTPEAYPLSLNALVAACNQKSSREPVLQLAEREVHAALRSLEDKELVSVDHGSRVERYENRARTVFSLRRDEAALLCLLLLRGAQTPGELRGRADRLFAFDDAAAVGAALQRMGEPTAPEGMPRRDALVTSLARQPGAREQRYVHLLCGEVEHALETSSREAGMLQSDAASSIPSAWAGGVTPEVERLQASIDQLQQRITAMERALETAGIFPV